MSVKSYPAAYGQLNIMSKPSIDSDCSIDQFEKGVFHTADVVDEMCCGIELEEKDDSEHNDELCYTPMSTFDESDVALLVAQVKLSALLMNRDGETHRSLSYFTDDISHLTEADTTFKTSNVPFAKNDHEVLLPLKFVVLPQDEKEGRNTLPAASSIASYHHWKNPFASMFNQAE